MRPPRLLTSCLIPSLVALGSACSGPDGARGAGDSDAAASDFADGAATSCERGDRDGDGWSDELELALETSADDPADDPDARGLTVFVMPFEGAPVPAATDVITQARLARADVAILLDTTGSMLGTLSRMQPQLEDLIGQVAGSVDDLAFGLAGYGDFPIADNANSGYDVPFYRVHRIMTARTAAGLASLVDAARFKNIITDGLGPWFAIMRGGDEPEQGWEALRQVAAGVGITYPGAVSGQYAVPPFQPGSAHPVDPPAGEEVGGLGGLGFRADSIPIVVMISDTTFHAQSWTGTSPVSATRTTALAALAARKARVVGVMVRRDLGHADLADVADATDARVRPEAWGSGSARPANCPVGRCCLVADEPGAGGPAAQPLPEGGFCSLVFQSDFYDSNLAEMITQAVVAIARGGTFAISAEVRDGSGDEIDVVDAFVDRVEAVATGPCVDTPRIDGDGDGILDGFTAAAGASACFKLTVAPNTSVPPAASARAFPARLQLTGDGVAGFSSVELRFVVPSVGCGPTVE